MQAEIDTLNERLLSVERALVAALGSQCTAERPHPDGLVYIRGPNEYQCRCGKVYVKSAGGLKEQT